MARIEKTVFLSYRRTNFPWALSIYQNLTANGFDVFFDYKGIASGDFESVILENIRARAHFLVALTPSALERCADPGDWLRREIEEAIECRRNIVPLLLEGFDFSASAVASQLTGRLAELKKYNGLTLPVEYFDAAMERLREKFLNVPVNTELHRASAFAREAAKDQQAAVGLVSIEAEKRKQEEGLKAEERQRLEEEQKRKQTEKETERANKERNEIKVITKKKSATKIGALIALAVVIVASVIFFIWQETSKHRNGSEPLATTIQPIPAPGAKPSETSPPRKITNSIGMEFVLIPAGSFSMGSRLNPKELVKHFGGKEKMYEPEQPSHEVKISQPFYIQTTEVTQGQWIEVMNDNPSKFNQCGDDCAVENVSWDNTQRFIEKLNQREKTDVYRLPSEAEWEYACRAGIPTEFSFGDSTSRLGEYAWYSGNSNNKYQRVASRKANDWGLYDMHGNVWEWCQDWYSETYYKISPKENPEGAITGSDRVIRGGSWINDARDCRSAVRLGLLPDSRGGSNGIVGFRLSRSVALGP